MNDRDKAIKQSVHTLQNSQIHVRNSTVINRGITLIEQETNV